jgi:hypothetical protein
LTVEPHLVSLQVDPVIGVLDDTAVDGDATRMNPAARLDARTDTSLR